MRRSIMMFCSYPFPQLRAPTETIENMMVTPKANIVSSTYLHREAFIARALLDGFYQYCGTVQTTSTDHDHCTELDLLEPWIYICYLSFKSKECKQIRYILESQPIALTS